MERYRVYPGQGALVVYVVDSWEHPLDLEAGWGGVGAAVVQIVDARWNQDLSPWVVPGLPGGAPFSGGAEAYLQGLIGQTIPRIEAQAGLGGRERAVAGYSLAGLFALYALTRTAFFSMAASVSGSLWYEGWLDYLAGAGVDARYVYLSLGKREKCARSPRLAQVEACTQRTLALLQAKGISAQLHMHPGGHFCDPAARMAAACAALARA